MVQQNRLDHTLDNKYIDHPSDVFTVGYFL